MSRKINDIVVYGAIGAGAVYLLNYFRKQKEFDLVDIPLDPNTGTGLLTPEESLAIANRLEYAMTDIGTFEQQLFDNLSPLTGQQLVQVFNSFGERPYAFWGNFFGLPVGLPLDLFGWFKEELGTNELNQMRQLWAKSGLIFPA
jgi:hypothetical protein